VAFESEPFGSLKLKVKDAIREHKEDRITVPCDKENNYTAEVIKQRQEFTEGFADTKLEHLLVSTPGIRLGGRARCLATGLPLATGCPPDATFSERPQARPTEHPVAPNTRGAWRYPNPSLAPVKMGVRKCLAPSRAPPTGILARS